MKIKMILLSMLMGLLLTTEVFAGEWLAEGDKWRYIDNGQFVVNDWRFITSGGTASYYYFDELGYMCVGIKKIGNDYYSFLIDGRANTNDYVEIDEKKYRTRNKGVIVDMFSTANFDVDAYNKKFIEDNTMTAERLAYLASVSEAEKQKNEKAKQEAEKLEQKGPKANYVPKSNENGPGNILK